MSPTNDLTLIAVDIGNSRIKLGRFERAAVRNTHSQLSEPTCTYDLPITSREGQFDADALAAWAVGHVEANAEWRVASVHRGAAERLTAVVEKAVQPSKLNWQLRRLTYRDLSLPIHVDDPGRVGIDRLLAALAANRLRRPERAAIVVDLGSAMTVDLLDASGAFAGGAILPGIAMSARALAEHTDALPRVAAERLDQPPAPLGKSTVAAIEAGLYWGAVGAIRELVGLLSSSAGGASPPDVFLTGGASAQVAELLAKKSGGGNETPAGWRVRHVPHLVLAGIALVDETAAPDR